jgi:MFS family permease
LPDSLDTTDQVPGRNIGPIALAVFLGGIGGGIAFPILPLLGLRLGLSGVLIGFILSANRITRLGMNPVSGHWIDRIGGKRPLALGLLIEAASTGLFSLALHTSVPGFVLLSGRALWGVGSSMLIVGSMTLALNLSSERTRGRSTAAVRMAMSLGMPAGLLAGGVIAGVWSDNAAFLTATASALAAAVLSWLLVPDARTETGSEANQVGGRSLSGGVAGRFKTEFRTVADADPRVKTVWLTNLLVFLSIQGILLATLVLVIHYRGLTMFGFGVQPTAGVLMAIMILSSAGMTLLVGRTLDRITSRIVIALPAVCAAAIGFAVLGLSHKAGFAAGGLILIGIGMGGTSVPLLTLLGDLTPPVQRGHTVGIYQFFGDIGGSLGPIVGVEMSSRIGFEALYLALAALLLLIVGILVRLRSAERRAS